MVSDPASDKIFEEFILKESPEKKSKKSKSKDKEKESKKTSRKEPDAATKLKVAGVENDLKAKLLKKQQERKNSKNPFSKKFFIKLFRIAGIPKDECEDIAKKETVVNSYFLLNFGIEYGALEFMVQVYSRDFLL